MQDKPSAAELVEAVRHFLQTELLPTLNDPRLKFRALVAANVLTIVGRELEIGEEQLRGERERLIALLNESATEDVREDVERMTRELAQKIRAGEADDGAWHEAVAAHVEKTVMEKLAVANPKYLARVMKEATDSAT